MTATPTHPTAAPVPARPDPAVLLDADEAADLAGLLDLIEDWLQHADDDARADLAGYLDGGGHGHLAAVGLVTTVEQASRTLHRRLKQATR
jgi:hypothetical protein